MIRVATIVLALLCASVQAQENEVLYVTDRLILNLYPERDQTTDALRSLPSGTRLEVISRDSRYAQVRTDNGETGWVKATFLVPKKPAKLRLEEAEQQIAQLQTELAQADVEEIQQQNVTLGAELEKAQAELDSTQQQAAGLVSELDNARAQLEELAALNQEYEARQAETMSVRATPIRQLPALAMHYIRTYPMPIGIAGGVVLALLIIGLLLGMSIADRRQRRKLSGFRLA